MDSDRYATYYYYDSSSVFRSSPTSTPLQQRAPPSSLRPPHICIVARECKGPSNHSDSVILMYPNLYHKRQSQARILAIDAQYGKFDLTQQSPPKTVASPSLSPLALSPADVAKNTYHSTPLIDTFRRRHDYLRISLTEKCNLRCTYVLKCSMPA